MVLVRRLVASSLISLVAACGATATNGAIDPDAGVSPSGTSGGIPAACQACVTDKDCGAGAVCAQFAGDSYCAPVCPNGNECASDHACTTLSTVSGQQESACVPRGDVCGTSVGPGVTDAGAGSSSGGGGSTCGSLNGPNVPSKCSSCGTHTCQPNGCYGGWYCNTTTNKCQAPPASCGGSGGSSGGSGSSGGHGTPGPYDGGAPVTATIGPNGGTASRLLFAIVGDTRPASIDDTKGYPSAIIDGIYGAIQAESPSPPFVVSTGDYMFASTSGAESGPQLDLYMTARSKYSGVWFPTMGNHECTGMTASNCGAGNKDGTTSNFTSYLSKALGPIQKTDPYYAIKVNATDGSWTSKFVFVAANAWSPAQATWLQGALAEPTTYTFIVRHEPASASTAPGVSPSEQIMAQHPYTLSITGHSHTYAKPGAREIIVGNGGAPLTGGATYGYGMVSQRADGAVEVDMIDSSTKLADVGFRFAVKADGSPAP